MALPPPRMPGSEGGIFPPVAPSKQTLRAAFADKDALKASCDAASRRAEGKAVAKFGHHPRHITGSDGLRYARWLSGVRGRKAAVGGKAPSICFNIGSAQCLETAMFHYKEVDKEPDEALRIHWLFHAICPHAMHAAPPPILPCCHHSAMLPCPILPFCHAPFCHAEPLSPRVVPLREVCPLLTAPQKMQASGIPCWSTSAIPSEFLPS